MTVWSADMLPVMPSAGVVPVLLSPEASDRCGTMVRLLPMSHRQEKGWSGPSRR